MSKGASNPRQSLQGYEAAIPEEAESVVSKKYELSHPKVLCTPIDAPRCLVTALACFMHRNLRSSEANPRRRHPLYRPNHIQERNLTVSRLCSLQKLVSVARPRQVRTCQTTKDLEAELVLKGLIVKKKLSPISTTIGFLEVLLVSLDETPP